MDTVASGQRAVLVLGGATGLLGQALARVAAAAGYAVTATGRQDFDPCDSTALADRIDAVSPQIVFNAIAYTQVEQAEDEEEAAMRLNRVLPCALGRIVKARPGVHLVHFSTDFVFDGRKTSPYAVDDAPNPLNAYGRSKLAGEQALLQLQMENCCIVRTAWLFGPDKKNFVRTILDLCRQRSSLNVVHDQIGSPTYSMDLAAYSLKLAQAKGSGIFHIVNSGEANWCELAAEAVRLAQVECSINAIPSSEYPQKAVRPAYSVLDTSRFASVAGVIPRPWPQALADYIYTAFPAE